jgi:hypothetical protein
MFGAHGASGEEFFEGWLRGGSTASDQVIDAE